MHAAYKNLPAPVAASQHRRTSSATTMSRLSRITFLFVLVTIFFRIYIRLSKPYNDLHSLSIDKLESYAPSTTSLAYHKPWTSIFHQLSTSHNKNPFRIGMATVAHGSHLQTAYTLALQTHLTYANLHAYPTHLLTHPILPGLWTKECHLLSVLLSELSNPNPSTRLHWLIWLDADTIIMNPRIPLSTFLPPDDQEAKGFAHDLHMLYTRDWNGLNNGVFFLRVSEWSVEFLSAVLALRSFKPEEELRFTEQSAMEKVMGMGKFEQGVVEVPPFWFNSYVPEGEGGEGETEGDEDKFGYRRGQFLVHFAGKGDKEGEMGKWMDVLRRNRNVLEVEVEETNLGPQVEEFWRSAEEEWLQDGGKTTKNEKQIAQENEKEKEEEKVFDDGRRPKLTTSTLEKAKDVGQNARRELWDGLVL